MYKMKLELGDTSNDGHGKTATILLKSNVDVSTIRKAYKDSCYLTDVQFNINNKFTKTQYTLQNSEEYEICTEYEDTYLNKEIFIKLQKFGLTEELLNSFSIYRNSIDDERYSMGENNFFRLWIWFVKLSLPKDTIIDIIQDNDIPSINNSWPDKELNEQFGYGLFT